MAMAATACLLVATTVQQAQAKTALSLPEQMDATAVICFGNTTHYLEAADRRSATGTLHVLSWIKETGPHTQNLTFRGTPNPGSEVALWQLQGNPATGKLEEAYPWARIPPQNFISLPEAWSNKVLQAVDHNSGEIVGGLKLHLMRVPFPAGGPLAVWAVLENTTDKPIPVCYPMPRCLKLRASGPSGEAATAELPNVVQLAMAPFGPIPPHAAVLIPGGQLPLIKATQPGKYKVEATFQLAPQDQNHARALMPDENSDWTGKLTATLEANLTLSPATAEGK